MAEDPDHPFETLESAGYSWEDWLPVFEPFEEHDQLTPHRGEAVNLEEKLSHPDNETGSSVTYYVDGPYGGFEMEYSPSVLEEGHMLTGKIPFYPDFDGEVLHEKRGEIAEEYSTGYLIPRDGEEVLAEIKVPEDYDRAVLEETIQAGVDMVQDAQNLQNLVREKVSDYQPGA